MDLVLIAAGGAVAFLGSRLKGVDGARTSPGNAMLGLGGLVLLVGLVIFMIAFANGFSDGVKQGG